MISMNKEKSVRCLYFQFHIDPIRAYKHKYTQRNRYYPFANYLIYLIACLNVY